MDQNILLDSKQLLFFKRTAELQHMTRAAEDLNVSQPFLSNTISALEASLGVKLFDHKGRGIVLNEYGMAFYNHVVRLFNESENAIRELDEMKTGILTNISVGTNVALYMPHLFKNIQKELGDLNIHMTSLSRNKLIKLVTEGRLDFVITTPGFFDNKDLVNERLLHEKAVIIHSDQHWLKDYSHYPLKDLVGESFISVAPGYGMNDALKNILELNGIKLNTVISTTDTTNTLPFVKSGLGIALAPFSVVKEDPYFRCNHTVVSDLKLEGDVYMVYRKNLYSSAIINKFIDLTKKHFLKYEEEGNAPVAY